MSALSPIPDATDEHRTTSIIRYTEHIQLFRIIFNLVIIHLLVLPRIKEYMQRIYKLI